MKQKTFAIIGGTLWGNRGAEAMVVTTRLTPNRTAILIPYKIRANTSRPAASMPSQ